MEFKELEEIILEFLNNDNYNKIAFLKHHNTSRLVHTLNVTACAYHFTNKFNLNVDFKSLIRGCMLHDFFLYEQYCCPKGKNHLTSHPKEAYKNSKKYFDLNEIEKEMILLHMFPCTLKIPKNKETWILILADKYCATMEFFFKKIYIEELRRKEVLRNTL